MVVTHLLRGGKIMTVAEIMRTILVTITMDYTIGHAREIMKKKYIRHLLVMEGSQLVGVITDRDIRSHLSPRIDTLSESIQDKATLETKIHHAMTRNPITVSPDTTIAEAANLILKYKIGCLPVIDRDGFTIGIVTDADFLRHLAQEDKEKEKE